MPKNIKFISQLPDITNLPESQRNQIIIKELLKIRNIENIEKFLNPSEIDNKFLEETQELFGDQFESAIIRIQQAISNNESIVIHGDYDVDGVSATAILWETIYYELGYKNVFPFIPHRIDHGYGVSTESINQIIKELEEKGLKPGLLITVDCGITAFDSVEYAKDKGFNVIVSDHHTISEKGFPKSDFVLHTYKLCAAGISWVISRSLFHVCHPELVSGSILNGVDLVALATLSDIQPLTEFNRSFVKYGLIELSNTKRIGLQKLYEVAGISGKPIGTYEVGWVIGPRLNATGRLEHALDSLRILVVRHKNQAIDLAQKLNQLNSERQQMTLSAVGQAIDVVEHTWNKTSPIIVASSQWHEGIIGLIAGKLTEKYQVPSIAIAMGDSIAKGSARSVSGINIVEILRIHEELFESVGGHAGAAGFSLRVERLESLKVKMLETQLDLADQPEISADLKLQPEWITFDLYLEITKMEPFGMGNPKPVFYSQDLQVTDSRLVGKNKEHLAVTFSTGLRGIGFGLSEQKSLVENNQKASVIYSIDQDTYSGSNKVQLKIKEII